MDKQRHGSRTRLYEDVTTTIIAQLEEGCLPWVQPWQADDADLGLPSNAVSGRPYSGINILILWSALFGSGYATQRWLTYRQAMALGGSVRKGESGVGICYADRFVPKGADGEAQLGADGSPRHIPFLKRFTVFNID
jgi:antirestriction protein ArdC